MVQRGAVAGHERFRSNLTGLYERAFEGKDAHLVFRYKVLRVWQMPVESFLTGGLGLLPLAPISAVRKSDLPAVIERMKERLSRPEWRPDAGRLWTATYVLMGLRYPENLTEKLLEGVRNMEESVTYQAIVRKGFGSWGGWKNSGEILLLSQQAEKFGSARRPPRRAVEAVTRPLIVSKVDWRFISIALAAGMNLLALPKPAPGRRRKPKALNALGSVPGRFGNFWQRPVVLDAVGTRERRRPPPHC